MGFIKEVYSGNRGGLVVAFGRGENSANYFSGDSTEAAMKYFNMYLKNNEIYIQTEDAQALESLGINPQDASEFRSTVNDIINVLTDEQAIEAPILFPIWQPDVVYKVGDRVRYENKLYKVIQDHTSQPSWTPIVASSLFTSLLIDVAGGTILDWKQPDSTNGYTTGDKVKHNNIFYISTADNNVFEPGTVGAPWEEYIADWSEEGVYYLNQKVYFNEEIYISTENDNITAPDAENNSWQKVITQPEVGEETSVFEWTSGATYMIGDHILYEGVEYESLIDNNVWSPMDYPAGWNIIK